MANKYLDNDGVLYLWNKVKALVSGAVPTKTSDLTNDSGFITSADVPEGASASTAIPLMDGTAAVGSSTAFARGDHVHPSDTSKVDKVTGKGLSTNDYTDNAKGKLLGIAAANGTGAIAHYTMLTIPSSNDSSVIEEFVLLNENALTGVQTLLNGKVDKVSGKGLSTNDYTTAEKNKLAAFSSASDYALKSDITNMYKYKGSVATVSALPSSGNTAGDVYNVEASGMNYAWDGTEWDALGEIFTITAITNAELDTICT